jgi:hypothetical protein
MLWRLLPRLIWRYRRLLVFVMLTAALLGAATSVAPLFLESSERQALAQEFERRSRFGLGLQITFQTSWSQGFSSAERLHRLGFAVRDELEQRLDYVHGLSRPLVTFMGSETVAATRDDEVMVRLIHRSDALDHVTNLSSVQSPGVWISDVTARNLNLAAGDSFRLHGNEGSARARVAGIYRFLPRDRERAYWTQLSDFIDIGVLAQTYPAPFVIASRSHHRALIEQLRDPGELRWEVPLADSVQSLDQAKSIQRVFRDEIAHELGSSSFLGSTFRRTEVGLPPQGTSVLPGAISSVQERIDSITPAIHLLAWTARLIALATLSTAGIYLVRRRRTEVNALLSKGVAPLSQVARLMFETALPLLVGALLGMFTALSVISWIGSSLPLSTLTVIWQEVCRDLLLGWILLGLALGVAIHNQERALGTGALGVGSRKGKWAAALIGAAVAGAGLFLQGRITGGDAILAPTSVAAPVAVMIGASLLGALVAVLVLARVVARSKEPIVLLGLGRLAGAASGTLFLIAASAASLGVLVYGLTVSSSVETTAQVKAKVFVGSDVAASVGRNTSLRRSPKLPFPSTEVVKVPNMFIQPANQEVEVLAVDADTFAEAAYWSNSFSEHDLTELLSMIDSPGSGSTRAVMVGPYGGDSISLGTSTLSAPLDVVASVEAWPGMSGNLPLVVVERDSLEPLLASIGGTLLGPDQQIWAKASRADLVRALKQHDLAPLFVLDSEVALESPSLQAMRWTLGVLTGLGLAAGFLSITGLMLNLESRHRATLLAAVLTRRMGLTGRRELIVWIVEIAATVAVSYGIALLVALPLADYMSARMDLRPSIPPGPIFSVPAVPLLAACCVLMAISFMLSLRLQRKVDRAYIPGLLRT